MAEATNLAVLSAMITPAVLISACGTLILSTSNRLGRATDRVRRFADRLRALGTVAPDDGDAVRERQMILALLPVAMRRARLIHRGLTAFYLAVGLFVLTSLVIGGSGIAGWDSGALPIWLGIVGAAILCYGAALLTLEARLSLEVTEGEMAFIAALGAQYAPAEAATAAPRVRFGVHVRRGDTR
jgi:hypothetical protein